MTCFRFCYIVLISLLGFSTLLAKEPPTTQILPQVMIETNFGSIVVELYPDQAPDSVANFLNYVDKGFYEGLIFHRVIPGFVIQAGGYDVQFQKKPTRSAIKLESNNGLYNQRGTLALARKNHPDSATSQFYINLQDNFNLDYKSARQPGYAVFGKVVAGLDIVDKIAAVPTGSGGQMSQSVPQTLIIIQQARRIPLLIGDYE